MLHSMPLIKPFRERYPEMTLFCLLRNVYINLIERKVDAAIRAGTLTDSSLRASVIYQLSQDYRLHLTILPALASLRALKS